jgi:hypothetical protein
LKKRHDDRTDHPLAPTHTTPAAASQRSPPATPVSVADSGRI